MSGLRRAGFSHASRKGAAFCRTGYWSESHPPPGRVFGTSAPHPRAEVCTTLHVGSLRGASNKGRTRAKGGGVKVKL